jgi:hypothetical protein
MAMKLDARRCELISDVILAALLVVPAILLLALSFDCGPWDEGHQPKCSFPLLDVPAYILQASMLVLAFGGFVLWLPIVLFAYVNSTRYKYRTWKAGALNKRTALFVVWSIASCLIGLIIIVIVLQLAWP